MIKGLIRIIRRLKFKFKQDLLEMSELLAKWLNEEVVLSKAITDFERDFASGYLLGELLYKFNQQDNFEEFSQKETISSKVHNFEKLEPTLRNLNIKFDSRLVDKIMKEERGYALRLLYQVKMILEKVYPPTDIQILKKTGKVGDNQPAKKIGNTKDAYNQMQSTFFKARLQVLNKAQKSLNIEIACQKFMDEEARQIEDVARWERTQKEEKERTKQEIRRAQINKLQRNAGFMEEWLQKGVEDWKQNMAYKKEREQAQLEFEYKQAQKFNAMTTRKIDDATKEVIEGISNFEETLKSKGINPRVEKDNAHDQVMTSLAAGGSPLKALKTQKLASQILQKPTMGIGGTMTKTGGVTLASIGLRSQAKKPLDEKGRKEKERRRMRMIADQHLILTDIEHTRRQNEVVERMKRQSRQEEELNYEAWRTGQCKNVIIENRKLREAKYDKRNELDVQNAVFKEKQMLDSMHEQMNREIETLSVRDEFLRVKDKEAKKLRQTVEARKMVEAIFDIADEAYQHQQEQDADHIDPRNWHEWLQLFVEGAPIKSENGAAAGTIPSTCDISSLEYLELCDYLQNKGQWTTSLVASNKPNILKILSAPAEDAPAAGGKGKAPPKGAVEQTVTLEEGDAEVPDSPPNNFLLGDAIQQIINLNFPARGRQLRPKNPHYLNLKLCFVGYAFSGKRLQSMKLQKEYGLDTYTMSDLVEEALQFFRDHPHPIAKAVDHSQINELPMEESRGDNLDGMEMDEQQDRPPELKSLSGGLNAGATDRAGQMSKDLNTTHQQQQRPQLGPNPLLVKEQKLEEDSVDEESEQSEVDEELNPEEDMRRCGQSIQDYLFNGEEIPDSLYIDLYMAKLRMTYAYKSKATLKDEVESEGSRELELTRRLGDLHDELVQMQDPESGYRKKKGRTVQTVHEEIEKIKSELNSVKQLPTNGWILVDFPTNFNQAMLLEKALSGYQIKEDLEKTQRELHQEEASLLVTPTQKPPPPKALIPSGLDAIIWFDCSRGECLRRALGRRIDSTNNIIYHINDNPPSIEKSPLCEIIEPIDDESESMSCLIDRWLAFDQTSDGLRKWIVQFGDELTNTNLCNKIRADQDINSVFSQIDHVIKELIEQKSRKRAMLRSTVQSNIIKAQEKAEREKKGDVSLDENQNLNETSRSNIPDKEATPRNKSNSKLQVPPKSADSNRVKTDTSIISSKEKTTGNERENIEEEFKGTLLALWQEVSAVYKTRMTALMKKQRIQREDMQKYLNVIQLQFLNFLQRLDDKQQVLDKFIIDFNNFSDKFPDLREDDQTKEELHQRCDILGDELWEIAEDRKEQAVEERKKIMESGWIEYQLEYFTSCAQQMMQSEVDKFKGTIQLIHDYYHAIEEKVVPEAGSEITVDLFKHQEGEVVPDVEKLQEGGDAHDINCYSYPRLDDYFRRALKAQQVPDVTKVVEDTGKKAPAGKGAPPKGKAAAVEEEKPKVDSPFVIEMKEAIKVEKSILRYRLCQIRNWALLRLKHKRELMLKVYKKLEDWITVSNKAENDVIEEVCSIIKEAIETEKKLQVEFKINFMDFVVDHSVFNYIDPPPEKLPAMEQAINERFNIPQLQTLIDELKLLANSKGMITNREVVQLLVRKSLNSKSLADQGGLPSAWVSLGQAGYEKMVRNLDSKKTGSVDWKLLAVCCILLRSSLPTKDQIQQLKAQLGDTASLDAVAKAAWWFKTTEVTVDRDYSHPFERLHLIKQLLFSVFSTNNDSLNVSELVSYLLPTSLTSIHPNTKTYQGILDQQVQV